MNTQEAEKALKVAKKAAYRAGSILMEYFGDPLAVKEKNDHTDLVTEFDLRAEKAIISSIEEEFFEHNILAEESGENIKQSSYTWIIDPLDGTTNFAHGIPLFSVSIALIQEEENSTKTILGVIFDPVREELFSAINGKGAFLNGKKIVVSEKTTLKKSLIGSSFSFYGKEKAAPLLQYFLKNTRGLRGFSSAAMQIAYIAAGRMEGYWAFDLKPWDIAAGLVILQEAKGVSSLINGQKISPLDHEILATNGHLHPIITELLQKTVI